MAGRPIKRDHLTNVHGYLVDMEKWKERQSQHENGCIHYDGTKHTQGYGFVHYIDASTGNRNQMTAHRFAMMLKLDRKLSPKEQVIHTCSHTGDDYTRCVNPDHLFIGDTFARQRIMKDAGRQQQGPRAKQPTGKQENRTYKYTIDEMLFMRKHTSAEIRAKFQVTARQASKLSSMFKNSYTWLADYDK